MFTQNTFMGASVRDFTSSIGWNGGPGRMEIKLVVDEDNGDVFTPAPINTPAYFTFGGMNFFGIVQDYQEGKDRQGSPLYTVLLKDPSHLLANAEVIIGNYNGTVGGVNNLFNAYGYWESTGFGNSLRNETGMPWYLILSAVNTMANTPAIGTYGGPISDSGFAYSIDFSQIPVPPAYYRIGGTNVNLLEAIQQVCEDGGHDFFVELRGFTIVIRTVSRRTQPSLGVISQIINNNSQNIVKSSKGVEGRNEVTSSFLIGGQVHEIYQTSAVQSFWGYDILGNPILGTSGTQVLQDANDNDLETVNVESMTLNATPVADLLGSVAYACNTLEMRLAQASQDAWRTYIVNHREPIANLLNMTSPLANNGGAAGAALQPPDAVNDAAGNANALDNGIANGSQHQNEQRLYEFVRGYADEYMGKQFVVRLPFVLSAIDADTLQTTTSYELSSGGWVPEGGNPIGLAALNEDQFKHQDGRIAPLCLFADISNSDFTSISPRGTVVQGSALYMSIGVEPKIIALPEPAAVISLQSPLKTIVSDGAVGDLSIIAAVLQMTPQRCEEVLRNRQFGSVNVHIAPETYTPDLVMLALKNNRAIYGPWFAYGAPGKVKVEVDDSLTPWQYGGFDTMNLVGNARVQNAVTNMKISESGALEFPGMPSVGLGDVLQAGGPNVTNVDVRYGTNGVTTTYRFQTYTPKFGVAGKQSIERLKRLSLAGQQFRRRLREQTLEVLSRQAGLADAVRAQRRFLQDAPRQVNPETPHPVLISKSVANPDGTIRLGMSTCTYEESVAFSNSTDGYTDVAIMSLTGLLRPFSVDGGSDTMPGLGTQSITATLGATNLNPFKAAGDVDWMANGAAYVGLNLHTREIAPTSGRPMALRAPLLLSGWGYDLEKSQVPHKSDGDPTFNTPHTWQDDYLKKAHLWPTGPVDFLWDNRRKVWTCHDNLKGWYTGDTKNGELQVWVETAAGDNWMAYAGNWFGTAIESGSKVTMSYLATDNAWYISGATCNSSVSETTRVPPSGWNE